MQASTTHHTESQSPTSDRPAQRLPVLDLSAQHRAGQLVGGRFDKPALLQLSRGLYRSTKHVLLVGDRGVGKTTLLHELARQAAVGELQHLSTARFLYVDGKQIPGGDGPAFLEALANTSSREPEAVWCLDHLRHFLKSDDGRWRTAPLATLVHRTPARIIGVLDRSESLELQSRDPDLFARFTLVELTEPQEPALLEILHQQADRLSREFALEIPATLLPRCMALTSTFLLSERQPAKSIQLLQRVCEDLDFERTQSGIPHSQLREEHLAAAIAQRTGIPVETIIGEAVTGDYAASLREAVVGQERVLAQVATDLRLIKAGLNEPGKPASVMLFAGMTGVGKTELAKRIAELYSSSRRLQTYTMANFTEPHSVSGIIGVPPGYVGFEEGGRLINELNADPYAVFLLDEAEKAHPHVWKPFLNLFDEGWITDQRGVKAYADRAIFILTTNAGDRNIAQMTRTGEPPEAIVEHVKQTLAKVRHERSSQPVFPPAFLARIGRVLVFEPLDEQAMIGITQRVCGKLQRVWRQKRDKWIEVDPRLIDWIGRRGHQLNETAQGREGGRIIKKLVTDLVETRIQEAASADPEGYRTAGMIEVRLRDVPVSNDPEASDAGTMPALPEVDVRFNA